MIGSASLKRMSVGMLAALAAAALPSEAILAQQVGTAAAVNPAAQARGSGGSRTIVIGQSIAHRERIQTTSAGSVQLLFLDKTSMTIGPNSDLAIDEYVFDPTTNTGKMAATLSKGVMRFVGGQISHAGNAQVTTPTAVVGVRGAVAIIGTQNVYVGYGEATVGSGATTVTVGAGEYTQTQGNGVAPTNPAPPPPGFVAGLVATFQSQGGQGGGAPASQASVNSARETATGSSTGSIASATAVAANTTQQQGAAGQTSTVLQTISQITQTTQTVTQQAAAVQEVQRQQEEIRRRQFSTVAFAFNTTRCCSPGNQTSPVPYLPAVFAQSGNYYFSPIYGYRIGSLDNPNRAAFTQFGINITGTGASQNSWIFINQGAFLDDGSGGLQSIAGFVGFRRGQANFFPGLAVGANSSIPGTVSLGVDNIPNSASTNEAYWVPETRQFSNPASIASYDLGNGQNGTYQYQIDYTRIDPPATLGQNRPAAFLTGYVGGMIRSFNNTTGQFTSVARPLVGAMTLSLNPDINRLQANMGFVTSGDTSPNGVQSAFFQFGELDTTRRGRGVYVDYDNFAATNNREVINTTSGEQRPVAAVQVNGQTPNNQNALLLNVTRDVAQQISGGLGANINFCDCEYTRWGFWASHTNRDSNGNNVTDRVHLGTWVAGQPPNAVDIPNVGSATYNGHVVASIRNGANEYVAGGNFSNTVNFASRTGTASVSGLDGANYSGTLQFASQSSPTFVGGLNGNVGGRQMTMLGSLFRGSSGPVGEMGGNVTLSGTNYQGSGIFAGRRQ